MAVEPLAQQDIENRLAELPGWTLVGDRIARSYVIGPHFAAAALVVHIAQVQEELGHHADLTLGYNSVAVAVNTHSAGGAITELDIDLARRVETLAAAHGAE
ncbi:putative pterin-4a-carbinolamine dehydratase [Streptomyces albus]|uniref:Putative pterin-4-alpha-carbinolamine dehydratase n=1 Tax=Streptomyces albus (strain ATCC 21838 / DSM 41398 / FERM P-419 / JCM 4703 / NBRC 107858) TaxID=1081613 RepID=A0A0B5EHD1_STRA4|nr:putative pterin-4a-carbinolamine dehydratase [Streptomyces albus]AOU75120.1 putative pterin-4a-carbinolamine dehydratase [Streptomyces albus]AYN30925.1 4a-hydroxytetrahydrobiopterin dehydratase [Streptomyces albus]